MTKELSSWQLFLADLLSDPQERQRVASELSVAPITLSRWINGHSQPRPHNIRRLLHALPEHRTRLATLLAEDFADAMGPDEVNQEEEEAIIDLHFYERVLQTHCLTPSSLSFWSLGKLILTQALAHLDPEQLGLSLTILRVMPPSPEGHIRSLREVMGMGTAPWNESIFESLMLHGAESLAGYAVASGRPVVVQNLFKHEHLPSPPGPREASATAFPIMRAGQVAGCLLASSTQLQYFTSPRQHLLDAYANLLQLAFAERDFYPPQSIQLRVLPDFSRQQTVLATFRERLTQLMRERTLQQEPLTTAQAEQIVWQELEEELVGEG